MKMPIDKEWFERRAKAEDDLEIGAGFSVVNVTDADAAQMEVLAERALPQWAQDELSRLRSGIKRLSDEEELCAETSGNDPFSLVYLAAKLAAVEEQLAEAEAIIEERDDRMALVDRIADLIGLPHDQELDQVAFELWFSANRPSAQSRMTGHLSESREGARAGSDPALAAEAVAGTDAGRTAAPQVPMTARQQALEEALVIVADYAGKQSPIAAAIRALMTEPPAETQMLVEALRLVVKYDDLLRTFTGPVAAITRADNDRIDAAYDKMVDAARAALPGTNQAIYSTGTDFVGLEEAAHQALGALKALGAEKGHAAEALRLALNIKESQ